MPEGHGDRRGDQPASERRRRHRRRRHHHEAVQPDRPGGTCSSSSSCIRRRIDTRSTRRTATCSSASIARCRSLVTLLSGTNRRRRGSFRERTARPPIARRSSRACATTSTPSSDAMGRELPGWDVVNEAIDEDGVLRKAPWRDGIGDDYVAKALGLARARPIRTPSSITTTTTSRSRPSARA